MTVGSGASQLGMCSMSSRICGFIFTDSRKNSSTPCGLANTSLNGRPARIEPAASTPIGTSIHTGLSCAAS
ncbi:hypothetical protein ACVWY2_001580 [Bradyrhizobium sp. JR6.1]